MKNTTLQIATSMSCYLWDKHATKWQKVTPLALTQYVVENALTYPLVEDDGYLYFGKDLYFLTDNTPILTGVEARIGLEMGVKRI